MCRAPSWRLAFGAFRYRTSQFPAEVVAFLQLVLAGFVADGVGVTLALVWTAGFVPAFLDPAAAAVLLAKPTPRWLLLAGKFLGVLLFVAVQALVFVGGDVAGAGGQHRRLGGGVPAGGAALAVALRGVLRRLDAGRGGDAQPGRRARSGECCSGCCAGE